jgi:FAD/FMN-containing dehydrogenase
MAESAQDVQAAVRLARSEGRGVGVLATGHGTATACADGVLVNTSRMRAAEVDPVARMARVAAGARWVDLIPAAAGHGLAGLPGSSSHVGVVGFTMGGGFGWLGRRYTPCPPCGRSVHGRASRPRRGECGPAAVGDQVRAAPSIRWTIRST